MSYSWKPINPLLTQQGNFLAFSNRENAENLKPVALSGNEKFTSFRVFQDSFSLESAAKLGFSIGEVDANYKYRTLIYEAMFFEDKILGLPIPGQIYGTRWGAGIRVFLKFTELNSNANVTFGAIAASAQLKTASAFYEVVGVGIDAPEVISILPVPGEFNLEAFRAVLNAVDAFKNYLAKNPDKILPQPIHVLMEEEETPVSTADELKKARSIFFAMKNIATKKTLKIALQNAEDKFDHLIIKSTYENIGIANESATPTNEQKEKASDFIKI